MNDLPHVKDMQSATKVEEINSSEKPSTHSDLNSVSTPISESFKPTALKLHPNTKHLLEYQNSAHKKIFLRVELLQKLHDRVMPYFHEKLHASIALTYQEGALVLMVNNPALAVKIQRQQTHLDQLVKQELHIFLTQYLGQTKQLHLLSELQDQLLPNGNLSLLIRPFYKNM